MATIDDIINTPQDSGFGDNLYSAANKINNNFQEVVNDITTNVTAISNVQVNLDNATSGIWDEIESATAGIWDALSNVSYNDYTTAGLVYTSVYDEGTSIIWTAIESLEVSAGLVVVEAGTTGLISVDFDGDHTYTVDIADTVDLGEIGFTTNDYTTASLVYTSVYDEGTQNIWDALNTYATETYVDNAVAGKADLGVSSYYNVVQVTDGSGQFVDSTMSIVKDNTDLRNALFHTGNVGIYLMDDINISSVAYSLYSTNVYIGGPGKLLFDETSISFAFNTDEDKTIILDADILMSASTTINATGITTGSFTFNTKYVKTDGTPRTLTAGTDVSVNYNFKGSDVTMSGTTAQSDLFLPTSIEGGSSNDYTTAGLVYETTFSNATSGLWDAINSIETTSGIGTVSAGTSGYITVDVDGNDYTVDLVGTVSWEEIGAAANDYTTAGLVYETTFNNATTGINNALDLKLNTADYSTTAGHVYDMSVAVSDETTDLTTSNSITFIVVRDIILQQIFASVNTAPTGSSILIDVKDDTVSVLNSDLTISASATTGNTTDFASTNITAGSVINVSISQVGSTTAGNGLKIYFKALLQ